MPTTTGNTLRAALFVVARDEPHGTTRCRGQNRWAESPEGIPEVRDWELGGCTSL